MSTECSYAATRCADGVSRLRAQAECDNWGCEMGALGRLLNRRQSILMLVIVKSSSMKHRIVIPVPIAAVTTLVEAVGFWGTILSWFGFRWAKGALKAPLAAQAITRRLSVDLGDLGFSSVVSAVPAAVEELWRELISHGSWSLVDVKTSDGDKVVVRFI